MSPMELEVFLKRIEAMRDGSALVPGVDGAHLTLSSEGIEALAEGLKLLIKQGRAPQPLKLAYTYCIFCDDNNLQRIDASYDTKVANIKLLLGAAQQELRNVIETERARVHGAGRVDMRNRPVNPDE